MFFHSASPAYKYFSKMIAHCMLVSINASQTSLWISKYDFTSVIFQYPEGHQDHLGASTNQTCVPVCRFSYVPLDGAPSPPPKSLCGEAWQRWECTCPVGVGRKEGKMLSCTGVFKLPDSISLNTGTRIYLTNPLLVDVCFVSSISCSRHFC